MFPADLDLHVFVFITVSVNITHMCLLTARRWSMHSAVSLWSGQDKTCLQLTRTFLSVRWPSPYHYISADHPHTRRRILITAIDGVTARVPRTHVRFQSKPQKTISCSHHFVGVSIRFGITLSVSLYRLRWAYKRFPDVTDAEIQRRRFRCSC